MAKEATLQVRMDADIKQAADELYKSMGTTLSEAVRLFVNKSIAEQGLPFSVGEQTGTLRRVGRSAVNLEDDESQEPQSAFGMLSAYAKPNGEAAAQDAWMHAAVAKHAKKLEV